MRPQNKGPGPELFNDNNDYIVIIIVIKIMIIILIITNKILVIPNNK